VPQTNFPTKVFHHASVAVLLTATVIGLAPSPADATRREFRPPSHTVHRADPRQQVPTAVLNVTRMLASLPNRPPSPRVVPKPPKPISEMTPEELEALEAKLTERRDALNDRQDEIEEGVRESDRGEDVQDQLDDLERIRDEAIRRADEELRRVEQNLPDEEHACCVYTAEEIKEARDKNMRDKIDANNAYDEAAEQVYEEALEGLDPKQLQEYESNQAELDQIAEETAEINQAQTTDLSEVEEFDGSMFDE